MFHGWNGGGWNAPGFMSGFPWGGWLMGVLVAGLIALMIFSLVRSGKAGSNDRMESKGRGIDILIERYSRGEIDAETFRSMKAELDAQV